MKTIGINLVPQNVQVVHIRARLLRFWISMSCVGLLALGGALIFNWFQTSKAGSLQDRLNLTENELTKLRSDVRLLASEASQIQQQLERADALRSKRAWSGLLAMIAEKLPADCHLQNISTDPGKPPAESILHGSAKPANAAPALLPNGQPAPPPPPPRTVTIDAPRKLRMTGFANDPAQPVAFVSALKESGAFTHVNLERAQWEPAALNSGFRFELVCEW